MPKKALYNLTRQWKPILWLKPIKPIGAKAILSETQNNATCFMLTAQCVGPNNSFLVVFGCATQPVPVRVTPVLLIMAIVSWTWNSATPASFNGRSALVLQDLTLSFTQTTHNLAKSNLANGDSLNQIQIVLVVNLAMMLAMDVQIPLINAVLVAMLDIVIISVHAFYLKNFSVLHQCLWKWTNMDASTVFITVLSLSSQTQSLENANNVLKDVYIAIVQQIVLPHAI